jgi:hypothetical protein
MRRRTFVTTPPGPLARRAALLSIAGTAAFVALLAALHLLRPDLDPSWRFISEYELGEHGGLMRAAFVALAVGTGGAAVAVASQVPRVVGYLGLLQLVLSAAGMVLAATFVPDPSSHLHDLGAILDQVPFGALFIAWSLTGNERWTARRRSLWAMALLPLLGLVVFVVSMGVMLPRNGGRPGPTVLVGWQNRFMILAQCAWLLHTARQVRAVARGSAAGPSIDPAELVPAIVPSRR